MSDVRPINVQVEELTQEQKNNICKAYKTIFWTCIPALIIALIMYGITAVCYIQKESAYSDYELVSDKSMLYMESFNDFSMLGDSGDAFDEYLEASDTFDLALSLTGIVSVALFIVILVVVLVVNKKYPYYSEKKYKYIKKMSKNKN